MPWGGGEGRGGEGRGGEGGGGGSTRIGNHCPTSSIVYQCYDFEQSTVLKFAIVSVLLHRFRITFRPFNILAISSKVYLYSIFLNTHCFKAAFQTI